MKRPFLRTVFFILSGTFFLLQPIACSSLPDMNSLDLEKKDNRQTSIAGRNGLLSPQRSAEILRRLQQEGKTDLLERHLEFMQAIDPRPLSAGNSARLLIDGSATYRAMFESIRMARDHINLETYIFDEDGAGEKLARLLAQKQAEGVQVNVMYDSVGSLPTRAEFFQALRQAGVNVCEFNPVNPLRGKFFSLNNRDHRKMLIVDGKIGYTGGINISSVYSRSSALRLKRSGNPHPWRDTQIEIRGPAVREFQQLFISSWSRQNCAPLAPKDFFPALQRQGDMVVRTLGSSPGDSLNLIYVELLSALRQAGQSIHLTMAYFVPDPQTMTALKEAAQRGVDVQLVLPGVSDSSVTFYAGRSYYAELLKAGVRIYERKDKLLHAKTAVIDGVWSTVGSSNIDLRSFLYNDEVNAVVLGKDFAQEMEKMFTADVMAAARIDADEWEKRGFGERMKETLARMWAGAL